MNLKCNNCGWEGTEGEACNPRPDKSWEWPLSDLWCPDCGAAEIVKGEKDEPCTKE